jgi:prepilin-type processing-associated H-X9-DG protein
VHDGTAISKSLAGIAIVLAAVGMMLAMGRELLAKRHVGGAIISFADGHVKWIRLPEQQRWEVANEGK